MIYLDSDLVVLGDIAELYSNELEENILGAVNEVITEAEKSHWEAIGIPYADAFNSGALLINTRQFREQKIREKCMELLLNDWKRKNRLYTYMDEDVLNIICKKIYTFQCNGTFRDGI